MIDWKWFIEEAEKNKEENPEVRISVDCKNGFSKCVRLGDFLDLISEYQRLAGVCKAYGYPVDKWYKKAISFSISDIVEQKFLECLAQDLKTIFPNLYIRISYHETREYFVNFFNMDSKNLESEEQISKILDSISESLDPEHKYFLLPFFSSKEETEKDYPEFLGKKGVELYMLSN